MVRVIKPYSTYTLLLSFDWFDWFDWFVSKKNKNKNYKPSEKVKQLTKYVLLSFVSPGGTNIRALRYKNNRT